MRFPGRIQARLALAIVITALIPMLVASWMGEKYVRETGARYFVPEIGAHLDRSLALYDELAHMLKARMRAEAEAIASTPALRRAVVASDSEAAVAELKKQLVRHPSLVSLQVALGEGKVFASADRGRPLDEAREMKLEVTRPLSEAPEGDDGPELLLVFATAKAHLDEERTNFADFVNNYRRMDATRGGDLQAFIRAFTVLLGITIALAIAVGILLARGVVVRLGELATATQRVGAGNLSVRVNEAGSDEIAALARAFNRMLGEVEASRARIEYLQRISAWQEMARRLAHEIKNPLTPIQLGVQEIHRRYEGHDEQFRDLLDTTLEIVEDEVGTLRRLVSEFSDFARLPEAHLEQADLVEFLGEQRRQIERGESADGPTSDELSVIRLAGAHPTFEWTLPSQPAEVAVDRQMLRRVLLNLIQNAADALSDAKREAPKIKVGLRREGDFFVIEVEDNGPGIAAEMRDVIFDPYVTTKHTGTGLGLAIVKKIAIEHGGMITAEASSLGGARMRLTLPVRGTAARELPRRPEHPSRPVQ